jgi:hypothetical protein
LSSSLFDTEKWVADFENGLYAVFNNELSQNPKEIVYANAE